jgi:hypothetical protein
MIEVSQVNTIWILVVFSVLLTGMSHAVSLDQKRTFSNECNVVVNDNNIANPGLKIILSIDDHILPQWWTCSEWSDWEVVTTYCDSARVCHTFCPARVRNFKRTRQCCDEAGNCYSDTGTHSQIVGCCGAEYCPNPNFIPTAGESQ